MKHTNRLAFLQKTTLTFICLIIGGCGAPRPRELSQWEQAGIYKTFPIEEDIFLPAVGDKISTSIGYSIISHTKQPTNLAVELVNPVSIVTVTDEDKDDYEFYRIEIPKGTYQLTARDRAGSEYFGVPNVVQVWYELNKFVENKVVLADLKLTKDGKLSVFWLYPGDDDLEEESINVPPVFNRISIKLPEKPPSLRRELIYTGRTGNALTLLYREFINDMARPAFSQALQYDISTDNVIGYQSAKFRVIDANNTNISYEVLHPLDATK